ncbi:glycosyltransferase family 2 protein [Acidobacteriota bacterium]
MFDRILPLCLLSLSSALFRRRIFEEIGIFDEGLPACEDYDLGIRMAHRYPWHLITKPLIVKRGGHEDQLSRKFHSMDIFRIRALEKALTLDLSGEQRSLVIEEIVKKAQILVQGAEKRGNEEQSRFYRNLIEKYRVKEEK